MHVTLDGLVATKVVHLGDQLEGVNNPRTRAAEAHMLMKYYQEFFDPAVPQSVLFNDPFQVSMKPQSDIVCRVVMFLPWVVITGDFTRFLPAGKNTFGHGKNGKYYNTQNKVQKDEHLYVMDCLFCQRGARVSQFSR